MKRSGAFLVLSLLVLTGASANNKKETERVENAGKVMKEIVNVPDNRRFNCCLVSLFSDSGGDTIAMLASCGMSPLSRGFSKWCIEWNSVRLRKYQEYGTGHFSQSNIVRKTEQYGH